MSETAIVAIAAASAGLTAVIGSPPTMRFYPSRPIQQPSFPVCSYQQIAGERFPNFGVNTGAARALYQLSIWTPKASLCITTRELLRLAFTRKRGTYNGVAVTDTFIENSFQQYEDESQLHQGVLEVSLLWTEG